MGRLRRMCGALSAVVVSTVGLAAVTGGTASASVVLDNDRYLIPATTLAGAETGFLSSLTGPTANYQGSNIRFQPPPGMVFAHADTQPGVPPSPIANRPTDGDVLGSMTLSSMLNDGSCNTPFSYAYRFRWNELNWHGAYDSMKVAEIRVEYDNGFDLAGYGVYINVRLTGDVNALPTYELTIPSSASQGLFCTGAYYRQTAVMTAPPGKALARNSDIPGPQSICTTALSNTGQPVGYCTDYTLEAADGTSTGITATPPCTITGTDGPDVIRGSSGDDVICALGGDDRVIAGGGNDIVLGGGGDDRISGGPGDDRISGDSGVDRLYAGSGDDVVYGGSGADSLNGGTGDDIMNGGSGDDRATGGHGDDILEGGLGADQLVPGAGNDQAIGGPGADIIAGGVGNDSLSGGDGADDIAGNSGSDLLYGGPDVDACKAEPIGDLGLVTDC